MNRNVTSEALKRRIANFFTMAMNRPLLEKREDTHFDAQTWSFGESLAMTWDEVLGIDGEGVRDWDITAFH